MRSKDDVRVWVVTAAAGSMALGIALIPLRALTSASNLAFAFLAFTIIVAELGGRPAALVTAVVSAMSLNFFLTEPYLTLAISKADDVIAFVATTYSTCARSRKRNSLGLAKPPSRRTRNGAPGKARRSLCSRARRMPRAPRPAGAGAQVEGLKAWAEHAGLQLGEEEGRPAPEGRQGIAELVRDPAHEPFAGQAAQVVAHLADGVRGVGDAEEARHVGAEAAIGDALGGGEKQAEGAQEGGDAGLAELQPRGGQPGGGLAGEDQLGQLGRGQPAVMRDLFGLQQPGVDVLPKVRR
jgi:hypothetical protein